MPTEPTVHIIDDDEAVRHSLEFLFRSASLNACAHASPIPFLEAASHLPTGCVVTDVRMPEMTGLDLLRALRAQGRDIPVIVITGHGDVPMAVAAMKAGASDFFEKPFDDEALLASVRKALAGTADTEPEPSDDARLRLEQLSMRERQVLNGLLDGLSNKTIAYDLGISARTVEIYRAKLMTKMGAASFAELVRLAMQAGAGQGVENLP